MLGISLLRCLVGNWRLQVWCSIGQRFNDYRELQCIDVGLFPFGTPVVYEVWLAGDDVQVTGDSKLIKNSRMFVGCWRVRDIRNYDTFVRYDFGVSRVQIDLYCSVQKLSRDIFEGRCPGLLDGSEPVRQLTVALFEFSCLGRRHTSVYDCSNSLSIF